MFSCTNYMHEYGLDWVFIRAQFQPPPGRMATTRGSSDEDEDDDDDDSDTEKKNPDDFNYEPDKRDVKFDDNVTHYQQNVKYSHNTRSGETDL